MTTRQFPARAPRASVLLASIAILVGSFLSTGARAQDAAADLSPKGRSAVLALARAIQDGDRTSYVLGSLGFDIGDQFNTPGSSFDNWPALRKIEAAHASAVEAGGAEGGERFLRSFSRAVARDHSNAIRYEGALAAYFPEGPDADLPPIDLAGLAFRKPSRAVIEVSPEVRAVAGVLAKYVGRVPGGTPSLMAGCCNVAPDAAFEILRTSDSDTEALSRAIAGGKKPPTVEERTRRLVELTVEWTDALRSEPALKSYLGITEPAEPPPPKVSLSDDEMKEILERAKERLAHLQPGPNQQPTSSSSSGGGGGGGSPMERNFRAYERARVSLAPAAGSPGAGGGGGRPSFGRMIRVARGGFGGVVFGNHVNGNGVPRPLEIVWVPTASASGKSSGGRFDVAFADGISMTREYPAADAWAALALVVGDPESHHEPLDLAQEEGVGLAGLQDRMTGRFLVHPVLFGLPLGDAAILADARGFMMEPEVATLRMAAAGVTDAQQARVLAWLNHEKGWYKVTDAPLSIVRDGLVLRVRSEGATPSVRERSFLSFQSFGEDDKPEPESATPFHEAVPALAAAFPEYARLNEFAEIFAIVRWARASGARWRMSIPRPERGKQRVHVDDSSGEPRLVQDEAADQRLLSRLASMREEIELLEFLESLRDGSEKPSGRGADRAALTKEFVDTRMTQALIAARDRGLLKDLKLDDDTAATRTKLQVLESALDSELARLQAEMEKLTSSN